VPTFLWPFLGLEEARGILEFNNEVAKIESWIRDKELMVSQVRDIFGFGFKDFFLHQQSLY
jgi:hypothetical protein